MAVSKERTTMISTGKHEAEVAERIKAIKAEKETTDSEFDREKCEERIAKVILVRVRVRVRVGVRVRVRVRVRLRVRLRLRVTPTGHPGRDLVVALAVEEQDGHQVGVVERGVDRHARHHEVVGAAEGRGAEDPLELARLRG